MATDTHVFGDSHSDFAWRKCQNVITHHIGPVLCYSFGKDNLKRCDISKHNIKDGDTVIFSFGEIDCRCHIHKHISNKKTYQMIIDNIINNYIDAIKININNSNIKLKNVGIYNIVPPIQKNNTVENPEFPYIGSDDDRKLYVLYFNQELKKKCIENNWIFVDIYDKYTDKNGFLNKELSDGNVHINDERYLNEFINKYL